MSQGKEKIPCIATTLKGTMCGKSCMGPKGDPVLKLCGHHVYQDKTDGDLQCVAITTAGKQCSKYYNTPEGCVKTRMCWQHARMAKKKAATAEKKVATAEKKVATAEKVEKKDCLKKALETVVGVKHEKTLFIDVYEFEDTDVYFRNSVGTATDKRRPQKTWIEFYKFHARYKPTVCSAEGCCETRLVGAHVELFGYKGQYIIPLCQSHNMMMHGKYASPNKTLFLEPASAKVRHMLVKEGVMFVGIEPYQPASI